MNFDRDIIIITSDPDVTYIYLNGVTLGYGMENAWELPDNLILLFKKLRYKEKEPLIYSFWLDNWLESGEISALYAREYRNNRMFTDEELEILYITDSYEKFISNVKENLDSPPFLDFLLHYL